MISDTEKQGGTTVAEEENTSAPESSRQVVTFQVGKEEYGFDILDVREIVRPIRVTRIPLAPSHVDGVANLRGDILPIVDLRKKFGAPSLEKTDKSRILVVDREKRQTGLIVDAVNNVTRIEANQLEDAPQSVSVASGRYLSNVARLDNGQRIVMNLDADKICEIEIDPTLFDRANTDANNQTAGSKNSAAEKSILVVIFESDGIEYCLPIDSVREVIRIRNPRRPSNAPDYLKGILSLRGSVLPVIDLRSILGRRSIEAQTNARISERKLDFEIWSDQLLEAIQSGSVPKELLQQGESNIQAADFRSSNDQLNKAYDHLRLSMQFCLTEAKSLLRDLDSEKAKRFSDLSEQTSHAFDDCSQLVKNSVKDDQRIIVARSGSINLGLQVDKVREIKSIPLSSIEEPPSLSKKKGTDLVGVAKIDNGQRMILMIDPEAVIPSEDREALEKSIIEEKIEDDTQISDTEMNTVDTTATDELQLVCFKLGEDEFGALINEVREIDRVGRITAVPEAPDYVDGITNLRGEVLPVINLRKRFQLETKGNDDKSRIIVADLDGQKTGLLVDSVSHVLRVPTDVISGPPKEISGSPLTHFISGIAKAQKGQRIIIVLDLRKLLNESDTGDAIV